jgi:hypothetical protein
MNQRRRDTVTGEPVSPTPISQMTKDEIVSHLTVDHGRPHVVKDDWTKRGLLEAHRIIHLGLVGAADHVHSERPENL